VALRRAESASFLRKSKKTDLCSEFIGDHYPEVDFSVDFLSKTLRNFGKFS
jgi:hypothetical protein